MKKLTVEFNAKFRKGNDTFASGLNVIMFTPPVDEDYWIFRVVLNKKGQAIQCFPKFGVIGCGFAQEKKDWNTNMPIDVSDTRLYDHIKVNKGDKNISRADCLRAIHMLKAAVDEWKKKPDGWE